MQARSGNRASGRDGQGQRLGGGGQGQRPGGGGGGQAGDPLADPEAVARLICLRLLTAAPRTRADLAAELRKRRVPADAAEAVLSRFAEVGLIDDATFARAWVESRHHGRGLAKRALAAELGQRGVARGDIADAVGQLSPETELATARALVERRLASTRGLPGPARVRRLAGLLARKGYSASLTYRVVREALEQDGQRAAAANLDDIAADLDDMVAVGLDDEAALALDDETTT